MFGEPIIIESASEGGIDGKIKNELIKADMPRGDFKGAALNSMRWQIEDASKEQGRRRTGKLGLVGLAFLALMSAAPRAGAFETPQPKNTATGQTEKSDLAKEVEKFTGGVVKHETTTFHGKSCFTPPGGAEQCIESNDEKEFERLKAERDAKMQADMLKDLREKTKGNPELQQMLDRMEKYK